MPKSVAIPGPPCANCGFPLAVDPSQVGATVTCPSCGEVNEIVATGARTGRTATIGAVTLGWDALFLLVGGGAIAGFLAGHFYQVRRIGGAGRTID
jgi:phage FluMu protein Com